MTQQQSPFNTPDSTNQFDPQDINANKVVSGFAYFGILFFLPLVAAPQSKYGRFHANQGLILLLLGIAVGIVSGILSAISTAIFYATYSYGLFYVVSAITWVLSIGMFVLFIMGMINGFTGKAKELPLVGKIKLIK
ncbi:MAG: hypothetical protein ACC608_00335 [Anaerofustis sp.]